MRGVWTFSITFGLLGTTLSAAPPPKPVTGNLIAGDGFPIAITYYESSAGKDSPAVILLHMEGSDRRVWQGDKGLAIQLQSRGYAVVTVDLRKHGESRVGVIGERPKKPVLRAGDYKAMVALDLEAVKDFLLKEHQAKRLNIRKTAIVAAGMSTSVAAIFTLGDWLKRPYPDAPTPALSTPRGQDIRALVLISPVESMPALNAGTAYKWLSKPAFRLAVLVGYAKGDTRDPGGKTAKRVFEKLASVAGNRKRMYLREYPGKRRGTDILGRGTKLERNVTNFLDLHVKKLSDSWRQRSSKLEPHRWIHYPLVAVKPDEAMRKPMVVRPTAVDPETQKARKTLRTLYRRDPTLFPSFPPSTGDRARDRYISKVSDNSAVNTLLVILANRAPWYPEPPPGGPPLAASPLLRHLRPLLNHRDRGVRGVARMMLATRDDDDLFLFTRLSGALQDGEADAAGIAGLFDRIRSRHKRARALLPQFYTHPDPKLRLEVLSVVARLKLTDRNAQRLMLRSLESPRSETRLAAAAAILRAKVADQLITNDLLPMLDDKRPSQIAVACRALGTLGKPAAGATQRLTELLKHDDERVRLQAAGALFRIHGPDPKLVPVLAKLLKSRDAARRLGALRVLRCYGPQARPAATSLLEAMTDPDQRVAQKALGLLKIIQAAEK